MSHEKRSEDGSKKFGGGWFLVCWSDPGRDECTISRSRWGERITHPDQPTSVDFAEASQPTLTSLGQAQIGGRSLVAADGGLCSVSLGGLKADALNEVVLLLG